MYAIAAGHLAGSITMFSRDKDIETYNLLEQTLMILGVVNVPQSLFLLDAHISIIYRRHSMWYPTRL